MPAETVQDLKDILQKRDGNLPEFCQAVGEILDSLQDVFTQQPKYISVFERMLEPERVIIFRVPWLDDQGRINVNRGFRVQFNSAIGPYKGGCRFHPSVNLSVLKFLGFEQILKNSLTTLPMGGGKGGADFDPKGKSDNEVMRFCQSFMSELQRYIGQFTDVPAGDIGVGAREIGYMFGQYKRMKNQFEGVLTGKKYNWGGSLVRPEATGFGAVYFLNEMLLDNGVKIEGQKVLVSGAGNVAEHCVEKLLQYKAVPLSMSDSNGCVIVKSGITHDILKQIMELKEVRRGRLSELEGKIPGLQYFEGKRPWDAYDDHIDVIMPCATQNEIDGPEAEKMVKQGLKFVCEGANMPSNDEAIACFHKNAIHFAPGKASNAGGVATSGLEMTQNSNRLQWNAEEVDAKLHDIMKRIFKQCRDTAEKYGHKGNYQFGANVAGFLKVADSMIDQGCV